MDKPSKLRIHISRWLSTERDGFRTHRFIGVIVVGLILLFGFAPRSAVANFPYEGAALTPTLPPIPARFHASNYKWEPQGWNNQGPANLTQVLQHYAWNTSQDAIASFLKPKSNVKNVSPWEMVRYVNEQTNLGAISRVAGDLTLLRQLVSRDFGVIVETGYDVPGEGWMSTYLTIIGYYDDPSFFYALDTWLGPGADGQGRHEAALDFDQHWQQFNRLYIVVYPKNRGAELTALLGSDTNPSYNAAHALQVARMEAAAHPNSSADSAFIWFNMGSSFALLQQYKDAVSAFDKAISIGLPPRMLWYQFAPYEAYYHVGDYATVLALTQASLRSTPYVEETYYWQALAEKELGQTTAAIRDLEQAVRFNAHFTLAIEALAELKASLIEF